MAEAFTVPANIRDHLIMINDSWNWSNLRPRSCKGSLYLQRGMLNSIHRYSTSSCLHTSACSTVTLGLCSLPPPKNTQLSLMLIFRLYLLSIVVARKIPDVTIFVDVPPVMNLFIQKQKPLQITNIKLKIWQILFLQMYLILDTFQ